MGILSNDKIEETLNLPQDSLDRLRTSKFKHLYEQGQREAAVKLFQILQEQGIQETFYYNTMIYSLQCENLPNNLLLLFLRWFL